MKTSPQGEALIKQFESCRLHAYKDIAQNPTIGWGHAGPDVKMGMVWNQQQADDTLQMDLDVFERAIDDMVTVELNQNQFDALVDFTFNCGPTNLQKSTLLKLINESKFDAAALQFKRWCRAGGRVIPDLVKRRQAEAQLFLS